jgi:hypothetical protein
MDPVLFKAAEAGNIDPFENDQTYLNHLLTPDENTILHVYLKNHSSEPEYTDFVDIILERCPPLLFLKVFFKMIIYILEFFTLKILIK